MRRHRTQVLLAGLSCAACASAETASVTEQATITDSAGITIVQNHRPVWGEGEGWQVSAEPVLTIDSEAALGDARYVLTATRLSDHSIALLTDLGGRWFQPGGEFLNSFAVQGQGPGEFMYARDLVVLPGDTVVVGTMQKLAWYANARFVREHKVDWERLRALGRWGECATYLLPDLSQVSCQHDPSIPYSETNRPNRMIDEGTSSPGPGLLRQLRRQYLIPVSLDSAYPLGVDIGIEQQMVDLGGGRETFISHPFHARSMLAAGGDPMRIASATNPHWQIEVRSSTGQLTHLIRRDGGRRVPTAMERRAADSALQNSDSRMGLIGVGEPVLREKALAAMITPDSLPGHLQLIMSPRGEILSRQWSLWTAEVPGFFDVFDTDGRWLGTVTVPPRLRVVEVGEDYLLGLHFDEDDMPSVRLYRLEK